MNIPTESIKSAVFKQSRLVSLLEDLGFDIRCWKVLLTIAANQGESEKNISKMSGVSGPCCTGHIISMTTDSDTNQNTRKYYPLIKRVGIDEAKIGDDRYREHRIYLTDNAISLFEYIDEVLGKHSMIDSNMGITFSGENKWLLNNHSITYIELKNSSPDFIKEYEGFSNSLSEFKMPVICTVTSSNGDQADLQLYIDQEETLFVLHENIDGRKHIPLGDTFDLDGDKLFRIFEKRDTGIRRGSHEAK